MASSARNNNCDDEPDNWIVKQRFEYGLCHQCGNRIYNVSYESEGNKRRKCFEPVTIAGVVANGRCLLCYPLQSAKPSSNPEGESAVIDEDSMADSVSAGVASLPRSNTSNSTSGTRHHPVAIKQEQDVPTPEQKPQQLTHRVKDSDGLVFVGTIQEGTPEKGRGKFCHGEQGEIVVYEGEFESGYFHGKGASQDHGAGCVYEGEFLRGAAHGHGTCRWDQGWEYEGDWRMDKRDGKGRCSQLVEGGEVYNGEWKDDKWDGRGVLHFSGGGTYTGCFRKDKLHGHGTYEFADGSVYRGNFNNDLRHGHGTKEYICS